MDRLDILCDLSPKIFPKIVHHGGRTSLEQPSNVPKAHVTMSMKAQGTVSPRVACNDSSSFWDVLDDATLWIQVTMSLKVHEGGSFINRFTHLLGHSLSQDR